MTANFPWSDSMTVMQALGRRRMAKMVQADGTVSDYDSARHYNATTLHLTGIEDLRATLDQLILQADRCVVRGRLLAGGTAQGIRRLVYADTETGDASTLEDIPHRWLAIDAEGIARPADVPAYDLMACAEIALERLPSAFSDAQGIIQASASHGIKPDIRQRLWFWLDRAVTGAELKRWLAGASVDFSVFNPAQPIYTAAPVFAPGLQDHIPNRLAEWPGYGWVKVPPPEDLAPPPRPAIEAVRPAIKTESARARLYLEAALDGAQRRISGASLRHPAILSEACSLARFVQAGWLTESELHSALWSAAQQAGKVDEFEIGRCVVFGLGHPNSNPLPSDLHHG